MSYVPASRCVTGLPDESRREIVKESFLPTVATSLGLSARARVEGRNMAATAAASRIRVLMPGLYGRAPRSDSCAGTLRARWHSARPISINVNATKAVLQRSTPVNGSVPGPTAPVAARAPDADPSRPRCFLVTFVTETEPLTTTVAAGVTAGLSEGPEVGALAGSGFFTGSGFFPGSGVTTGFGVGCGGGDALPQLPPRLPFNACTSTSCPPEQGEALCGWLLPGPCRTVLGAAPFPCAICPAVLPLP